MAKVKKNEKKEITQLRLEFEPPDTVINRITEGDFDLNYLTGEKVKALMFGKLIQSYLANGRSQDFDLYAKYVIQQQDDKNKAMTININRPIFKEAKPPSDE
jgi:uncharacterized protein YaiL (DUF2058 family)